MISRAIALDLAISLDNFFACAIHSSTSEAAARLIEETWLCEANVSAYMWLLSVEAHLKLGTCICNGLQYVWQTTRREFASKDFLRVGIDVVFDGAEESRRELGSG